jgi:hypothetical protein
MRVLGCAILQMTLPELAFKHGCDLHRGLGVWPTGTGSVVLMDCCCLHVFLVKNEKSERLKSKKKGERGKEGSAGGR